MLEEANKCFVEGDFSKALDLWTNILELGT
jgi:hypothetical protein